MALGALAEDPNCGLKIIPCGMNYFHAHKFRSRAVVEFGTPVEVPPELVEKYKNGERREAVAAVLEMVYGGLVAVTVQAPDYDTLMVSRDLSAEPHMRADQGPRSSYKPFVDCTTPKARSYRCR